APPRAGFFEERELAAVIAHLPSYVQPMIEFAAITGWRIPSEVLKLEWRQVNFDVGEVRLDPGTTKNGEGRDFPFTDDLRAVLEERDRERERLNKAGHIVPWVFFRVIKNGRDGKNQPVAIQSFNKVWKKACRAAGCP